MMHRHGHGTRIDPARPKRRSGGRNRAENGVAPVVDSRVRRNSEKSLYRRNQRSNS
jgi:hypothetical protein